MKTSTGDNYLICYEENVVHKDIPNLPKTIWARIKEIVKERLTLSPEKAGDPLLGEFKGHRRIRTGDYRLIYRVIKSERIVIITAIEHREYIYGD
ncbi:type II toxin-antitoxin system RelE family toxin [Wolbachia endosymbiont of Oedothorax gibbosus]|uniref:type II toxin-antitoxin system RelE family toxin n=1 Tax=Wolbachia endosymbiont of Oedothorax gibbosus TaxID=931100 RepID=UPI0020258DCA|nr:type II toxin-antitoxin system RelE/ParE family toxin [Wolbachia endosymbiont of Oedothorax gibbosus]